MRRLDLGGLRFGIDEEVSWIEVYKKDEHCIEWSESIDTFWFNAIDYLGRMDWSLESYCFHSF